jgi:hypothetical protein
MRIFATLHLALIQKRPKAFLEESVQSNLESEACTDDVGACLSTETLIEDGT